MIKMPLCRSLPVKVLVLLWLQLGTIDAFLVPPGSRTCSISSRSVKVFSSSQPADAVHSNSDGTFSAHVVASDALILPGEGITLFLTEQEAKPLIQDLSKADEERDGIVIAVRLLSDDDLSLASIASLCEITCLKCGSRNEYVQVDLQCSGQVRLLKMKDQYSANHFSFQAQLVDATFQDETDMDKAIKIENNINRLMRQVSHMEQEIEHELCEQRRQADSHGIRRSPGCFMLPTCLYDQYEAAKANIERCVSKHMYDTPEHHHEMLRLTATSWGVFLCLNDPKLEARYRLKALDSSKGLERIKLAQHALKEKQLHLQGRLMQLQYEDTVMMEEAGLSSGADDLDAFQ